MTLNVFDIQLKCLKLSGYEVESESLAGKFSWKSIYVFSSMGIMFFVMLFEAHYFYSNLHDIQVSTDAVAPLLTCTLAQIKLITFYHHRVEFIEFISNLKGLIKDQGKKNIMTLKFLMISLKFEISSQESRVCHHRKVEQI